VSHTSFPKLRAGCATLASALALVAVSGCNNNNQTITLQSLESSGRTSLLCLNSDTFEPRDLEDCPDNIPFDVDGENRHFYSLVTQVNRGEVAVVDVTAQKVVDEDVSIPGFTFLPVGAQPTGIVSTPGSSATFVGVGEVGKEGIFAIPSHSTTQASVKPRSDTVDKNGNTEPVRDITSWPACRLPSTPGDMAILLEPTDRASTCPSASVEATPGATNLSLETRHPGERKLAVVLPDRGELVVIDAQWLLNQEPGSFGPCQFEQQLPLAVRLPAEPIAQQVPADLASGPPPVGLLHPVPTTPFESRPAGIAQLDDPITQEHRIYVADSAAPVVHVLDTSDPCHIEETAPLLPVSFLDPNRVVTTTRVAVSPLTTKQQRYLYAVDNLDNGSVLIFDVSPGANNRTPLMRPGSTLLPFEPPDRIAFDAPVRDVAFALHDSPIAPPPPANNPGEVTSQAVGVACDPTSANPAGAVYRPAPDFSLGARPGELRGVFGLLALESGGVSFVDVDDFDDNCRRPASVNKTSTPDFRGCVDDPASFPTGGFSTTLDAAGRQPVTDEVSCRVVETNRLRSNSVVHNDPTTGAHAPSLQAPPKLVDESGRTLTTDPAAGGQSHPKMRGVNFSATEPAQVYVGTNLVTAGAASTSSSATALDISPGAKDSSLVLSFVEPRVFAPLEGYQARYEGQIVTERPAGTFTRAPGTATSTLTDSGIVFCASGVEDPQATVEDVGRTVGAGTLSDDALARFGNLHADYVRILSDVPAEDNTWWETSGSSCAAVTGTTAEARHQQCLSNLGTGDVAVKPGTTAASKDYRNLQIDSATRNVLTLHPRGVEPTSELAHNIQDFLSCCFPGTVSYEVRAADEWVVRGQQSGVRHRITSDANGRCVVDQDPLKANLRSRVIETSCSDGCGEGIGPPHEGEVACIFDTAHPPSQTIGAPASSCIFNGLSGSFAIYAGDPGAVTADADRQFLRSQVDMDFVWAITGGFSPLIVSPSGAFAITSPQSISFSPQLGGAIVTDGARGISILDLSTLVFTPFQ
jgi:hypothetical protein